MDDSPDSSKVMATRQFRVSRLVSLAFVVVDNQLSDLELDLIGRL